MLISKIKVIFMRFFLFIFLGIFAGLYLSWPGILIPGNWKCFNEIIENLQKIKFLLKLHWRFPPVIC